MPHADSVLLPSHVRLKQDLWEHIYVQLKLLLADQRHWVSNLANAASLIYTTLLAFSDFGPNDTAVNWCGFYIHSGFFPSSRISNSGGANEVPSRLLLGPFCGKPACQFIETEPGKARGVCSDAYVAKRTILVPNVEAYPGHIACDNETKSEIVCPLLVQTSARTIAVGVLDLDCLAVGGFDEEDKKGLEKIAELLSNACDW